MKLMNKNIPVLEMDVNAQSGRIREITKILNMEYMPLLALNASDKEEALQSWMQYRCIPETRDELRTLLLEYGIETSRALSIRNLGLNLTDQYWFKPKKLDVSWENVNLFENYFETGISKNLDNNSYSPDASSNGELPKLWIIKNDERYLLKASTEPYFQQAYNEVIAAKLLAAAKIRHIDYQLEQLNGETYSSCKTFIDVNTEYIPALHILNVRKKLNHENTYTHFQKCAEKLKIPFSDKYMKTMLAFDYLINNIDRHYGNFGFIRNVETLEFEGIAPIFDNGNSLWYTSLTKDIKLSKQPAKPFADLQEKQLKLINNIDTIDFSVFNENKVLSMANDVFKDSQYVDAERIEKIAYMVNKRCNELTRNLSCSLVR